MPVGIALDGIGLLALARHPSDRPGDFSGSPPALALLGTGGALALSVILAESVLLPLVERHTIRALSRFN